MKNILAVLTCCCLAAPAAAILHPSLVNPRIVSCAGDPTTGPCTNTINYAADGISLVDFPNNTPPLPGAGVGLQAVGVSCDTGNVATGTPYTGCLFRTIPQHAPQIMFCNLRSEASWELSTPDLCTLAQALWIVPTATAVGDGCIMFVQSGQTTNRVSSLPTVFGVLSADVVANSRNTFCQHPLPPDVPCDVVLPTDLDHGVVGLAAHNVVTADGMVDCGSKPAVSILGGGRMTMAPGVTTVLTAETQVLYPTIVRLTSTLDTINPEPGHYSASFVVLVSPY